MATLIKVKVDIDISGIEDHFRDLCNDKTTMLEIHNAFAKKCDPYVPMLNGPLHESGLANVTSEYVEYGDPNVPYARYQYYGVDFNHTIEKHPLATAKWDEAMMRDRGDEFEKEVKDILVRRYRELYG